VALNARRSIGRGTKRSARTEPLNYETSFCSSSPKAVIMATALSVAYRFHLIHEKLLFSHAVAK